MNKFLKNLLKFIIPSLLILISIEILLRLIPNDYKLKGDFLNNNSNEIEVLIMGSSHAYRGFNPEKIEVKSFNAANISQSLDLDYEIFKKNLENLKNLKYVILTISYHTLFTSLQTSKESWRLKNYALYQNIYAFFKLKDISELTSNTFKINCKRLWNYYYLGINNQLVEGNGYGKFDTVQIENINQNVILAVERHTKDLKNLETLEIEEKNKQILNDFASLCKDNKIKVILITPPFHGLYKDKLNSLQLNNTINFCQEMEERYNNVSYHNFIEDIDFVNLDFKNADHLNDNGATKLSLKINTILKITTL